MSPLQLATIWSMVASFDLESISDPSTLPWDNLSRLASIPVDSVDRRPFRSSTLGYMAKLLITRI
jgi:hypothetical protein